MLTDLDIVNNALGRLGVERIASLSDSNKRAKLASDFLDSSRKVTLEMVPWDFALKRVELISSGTPAFEYTHSFTLPSDWVSIVSEYNDEEYHVEGGKILANTDTLLIKYVYEIDETVKRTPNFNKAWYLNLAAEMAYSLTQNNKLKNDLINEADFIASKAGSFNAKGSTPVSYEIDTFTDSRL